MSALPIREAVIARLQELSDKQVEKVLEFINEVQTQQITPTEPEEDDPMIGFISGPTDFAERSEEILWAELGLKKSGDSDAK